MEQARLDNHQYIILYTVYYYIVLYCISNHGTPSYSPWLIISAVIPLGYPPISIIPASVGDVVVVSVVVSVVAVVHLRNLTLQFPSPSCSKTTFLFSDCYILPLIFNRPICYYFILFRGPLLDWL